MELHPVKDIQPPKYPHKKEMSAQQIKVSVPQRWMDSRAAKTALGALAAMTLTGCTIAEAAETAAAAASATESAACTPSITILEVTAGVPEAPAIPLWPFFIAGAGLVAAAIWFFRRKRSPKKAPKRREGDDCEGEY